MGTIFDTIMGPGEVAEFTGLKRQTIHTLRHYGQLPEPEATRSGIPLWRRSVIEKWYAARLKERQK